MVLFLIWSHVNVVVSNSMYPLMERGDLVVVENAGFEFNPNDVKVGDIVVYKAHWPSYQYLLNDIYYRFNLNPYKTLCIFNEGSVKDISVKFLGDLKAKTGTYKLLEIFAPKSPTTPVIHRVIDEVNYNNEKYFIIKGDNNPIHDPELVSVNQIKQRVVVIDGHPLVIPYIGYISLWLKEYWYLVILLFVIYYLYYYLKGGRE
ncbi:Peptidase S24/S26A/S26B, conserved region [Methanocaldococcus vulcanius M7]|uniref:Peptidase S24/S26A/S26B, conserved region n=1 Tax=Methanocaldococcus vulcanius (strain ATCC 700851 / DSM 12094 / M7) TaxID=579137 RepID=C9RGF0_METVM|nr:Peptidase S24/S26A/S26B, conserved region [Methanocaldococcus vulcanius M7]